MNYEIKCPACGETWVGLLPDVDPCPHCDRDHYHDESGAWCRCWCYDDWDGDRCACPLHPEEQWVTGTLKFPEASWRWFTCDAYGDEWPKGVELDPCPNCPDPEEVR